MAYTRSAARCWTAWQSVRSRRFAAPLKTNRIAETRGSMNVSHDGDRAMRNTAEGRQQVYCAPTSPSHLLDLIDELDSGIPECVLGA
jgi:hypothetical protein